jgi:radical SAM superfamily enzyme YgiQ (UPF0313 family)
VSNHHRSRSRLQAILLALLILAGNSLVSLAQGQATLEKSSKVAEPIAKGQRVFTCGHSFHVWVPGIVTDLAKLAGIPEHTQIGVSSIGGSRTIQHWDIPDEKNTAKTADATSSPHVYEHADHLVLGEAELTLSRWLTDFQQHAALKRYEPGTDRADVTKTPVPRFDLLKLNRYLYPSVQFARGCPFLCEFCDIIELFGRVPRLKTPEQLLRELDKLYQLGYRGLVDIVDDNFIGNKRDVKKFLPHLIAWQEQHGFPFEFSTEASINLADDDELLGLMQAANFLTVFIGIESSDDDVLVETRKAQNTRRDMVASVQKLYSYGMWVSAGFILGFDGERAGIATQVTKLIGDCAIPVAMVGLLYALPGTQLTRRLAKEGRLFDSFDRADERDSGGDQCASGLNFTTLRPRIDVLRDYDSVLAEIYSPAAFFDRVRRVGLAINSAQHKNNFSWQLFFRDARSLLRVIWRQGIVAPYRREFWSAVLGVARGNLPGLRVAIALATFYLHLGEFSLYLRGRLQQAIRQEELAALASPALPARANDTVQLPVIA